MPAAPAQPPALNAMRGHGWGGMKPVGGVRIRWLPTGGSHIIESGVHFDDDNFSKFCNTGAGGAYCTPDAAGRAALSDGWELGAGSGGGPRLLRDLCAALRAPGAPKVEHLFLNSCAVCDDGFRALRPLAARRPDGTVCKVYKKKSGED
eukprot:gene15304-biopygen3227